MLQIHSWLCVQSLLKDLSKTFFEAEFKEDIKTGLCLKCHYHRVLKNGAKSAYINSEYANFHKKWQSHLQLLPDQISRNTCFYS